MSLDDIGRVDMPLTDCLTLSSVVSTLTLRQSTEMASASLIILVLPSIPLQVAAGSNNRMYDWVCGSHPKSRPVYVGFRVLNASIQTVIVKKRESCVGT